MTRTPEEKISDLKSELIEAQDAGASLVVTAITAMQATPEQRQAIAVALEQIADGRHRSRVTAIIARKVAERLRGEG
ncbi:hypothetical protein M3484_01840 [Pseudomonas sp. GX19020]|uniref:hypothetical protein n=1 Tax=Pseudomonas sp. GX19020 TaxID=2942277 RepID=UPI002018D38F|nr:hypothetical protein [Pseudomonas sp. GX19020]MCL4065317.1 hypothetical protein [Pseudomonas sp. GX19020]